MTDRFTGLDLLTVQYSLDHREYAVGYATVASTLDCSPERVWECLKNLPLSA